MRIGISGWTCDRRRGAFDPTGLAKQFLAARPRDMAEAGSLAGRHDDRPRKSSWTTRIVDGPLRHAVEMRRATFAVPAFVDLRRKHDVACVCADTVAWPLLFDVISDYVEWRLHGSQELCVSGDDDDALGRGPSASAGPWTTRIDGRLGDESLMRNRSGRRNA